jgi:precorrin-8X/cobalt-precorrin-8 methylmutase
LDYIRDPRMIEERSMAIIEESLNKYAFGIWEKPVVKRVVHATGDTAFADIMAFGPLAVEAGARALARGGTVNCDVEMVRSGLNRRLLTELALTASCRLNDDRMRGRAELDGSTRTAAAMKLALEAEPDGGIFVIGNAPTALFTLLEAVAAGDALPALVIGTPVGFVGAAEAKSWLKEFAFPWVTADGRKGGSAVAVAACNAMLALAANILEHGDK